MEDLFKKFLESRGSEELESDELGTMESPEVLEEASLKPEQPEVDPRLLEARDRRDKMQMYGGMLKGFQDIVRGTTGFKGDPSVANQLIKQGQQSVDDYTFEQDSKKEEDKHKVFMDNWSNKLRKSQLDITDQEKTTDPNSPESKLAQQFALDWSAQNNKELNEDNIKGMSAAEIYRVMKPMQNLVVKTMKEDMSEYQKQSLKLRKRELGLREKGEVRKEKGEERRGSQFEHKKKEKDELSDAQTNQLAGYDESMNLLKEASKLKEGVDTGPVVASSDFLRSMVGTQDIGVSDLKMVIGENLAAKVKHLSGTAASDKEREFINSISLPGLKDNDAQFKAKLERARKNIEMAKKARIESYKKQGKDPSAFKNDGKKTDSTGPYGETVERNGKMYKWNPVANKYQVVE